MDVEGAWFSPGEEPVQDELCGPHGMVVHSKPRGEWELLAQVVGPEVVLCAGGSDDNLLPEDVLLSSIRIALQGSQSSGQVKGRP